MIQVEIKTIVLSVTYLVGFGELVLAAFFWATHSKNEIRKAMALLAFSTGLWVLFGAATSYISYSTIGHLLLALTYIFGLGMLTTLCWLILIMPFPVFRMDRFHLLLLFLPILFFGYALLFSNTIIESFEGSSTDVGVIIGGPLANLFYFYTILLFLFFIVIALSRIHKLDGLHRSNIIILLCSVILGGLPSVLVYLILPIFSSQVVSNSPLASVSSALWLAGTVYILKRK